MGRELRQRHGGGAVSAWLKLVPAWVWVTLACLALAALVGGVQQVRISAVQVSLAGEQRAHSSYRTEVAERDRRAALAVLAENQRRQTAADESRKKAHEELEQAQADAAAADRVAGGLRAELARIRGLVAGYSGVAAGSQAGRSTADLLAELLEEVEREGRAMAAEADRRGVAGAACERAFDAVRGGDQVSTIADH